MSFFDKLKRGLQKTKNAIFKPFSDLFKSLRLIDEDLMEELEEILVCADVGAVTADEILTAASWKASWTEKMGLGDIN